MRRNAKMRLLLLGALLLVGVIFVYSHKLSITSTFGDKHDHAPSERNQHHIYHKHEFELERKSTEEKTLSPELKLVDKDRQLHNISSCVRNISVYTPHMNPFKAWSEYFLLRDAFQSSRNETSPYFRRGLFQHRDFPTIYIECTDSPCDIALSPTVNDRFLAGSDAVVVNVAPSINRFRMPAVIARLLSNPPRHVKIIFYGMESPRMMSFWDPTIADIKYHYMMTYYADSEIHYPYGRYIPGEPTNSQDINYAENKTRLLVWTASNCHNTFWPRFEWVKSLQKRVSLDIYGKCGSLTCLPVMSEACNKKLSAYKFYLALENAPCNEYITEKFWVNSLLSGVVPVVYGGQREAYAQVAPPGSFIHVSDFSSQQELADYLNVLNINDELYNRFFAWRKKGRVERIYPKISPDAFCKLHPIFSTDARPPVKTVKDSQYFKSCKGGPRGNFTTWGDINEWKPWK